MFSRNNRLRDVLLGSYRRACLGPHVEVGGGLLQNEFKTCMGRTERAKGIVRNRNATLQLYFALNLVNRLLMLFS